VKNGKTKKGDVVKFRFKDIDKKNNELLSLYVSFLSCVENDEEDAVNHINKMITVVESLSADGVSSEPTHTGFGLRAETYRLQTIIGEIGKEIIFNGVPKKETLSSAIDTLKMIKLYNLNKQKQNGCTMSDDQRYRKKFKPGSHYQVAHNILVSREYGIVGEENGVHMATSSILKKDIERLKQENTPLSDIKDFILPMKDFNAMVDDLWRTLDNFIQQHRLVEKNITPDEVPTYVEKYSSFVSNSDIPSTLKEDCANSNSTDKEATIKL